MNVQRIQQLLVDIDIQEQTLRQHTMRHCDKIPTELNVRLEKIAMYLKQAREEIQSELKG